MELNVSYLKQKLVTGIYSPKIQWMKIAWSFIHYSLFFYGMSFAKTIFLWRFPQEWFTNRNENGAWLTWTFIIPVADWISTLFHQLFKVYFSHSAEWLCSRHERLWAVIACATDGFVGVCALERAAKPQEKPNKTASHEGWWRKVCMNFMHGIFAFLGQLCATFTHTKMHCTINRSYQINFSRKTKPKKRRNFHESGWSCTWLSCFCHFKPNKLLFFIHQKLKPSVCPQILLYLSNIIIGNRTSCRQILPEFRSTVVRFC